VLVLVGLSATVALAIAAAGAVGRLGAVAQAQTVGDYVASVLHSKSAQVDLSYYENPDYHDTVHRAQQEGAERPTQIVSSLLSGAQGAIGLVAPALILLLVLRQVGVVTMVFNGNTRLPLVTGWDNLLPSWFTRLHPRFGTPVNSILFVSAITIAFSIVGQIGVGVQEAFQLLENAAGILYAFTYLFLFAIPLFGAAKLQRHPPLWLKVASASGFVMALLYSTLSVFPIIEVASWRIFALKIITVILVANVIGVVIYVGGRRRSQ
jgi:amino acid transporter